MLHSVRSYQWLLLFVVVHVAVCARSSNAQNVPVSAPMWGAVDPVSTSSDGDTLGAPPPVAWVYRPESPDPYLARVSRPETPEFESSTDETNIATTADVAEGADCACNDACNCCECQQKREALKKAIATAYGPVFFANNFNYLCDPEYDDWFPGDRFKRMCIGDWATLDLGGQYRAKLHNERNHRGFGLTGVDDDFLLHRVRLFANAEIGDRVRLFAEMIDAESNYENIAPRAIEVNRTDMLNLFADVRVLDNCNGTLTARIGRQELIYGNQRLISPLDWANTRRNFEGLNFIWKGQDWNFDVFFVEPVAVDPHNFDSAIDEQEFFGGYATYKGVANNTFDAYALQFNNSLAPASFQYTTLGGRWLGADGDRLWELEGGIQFGENTDASTHSAGFVTAGIGHKWSDLGWKPTLWFYYDWAQGNDVRGAGNGFNHLFPLGHKYIGFMDLFARSNIETPNLLLTFQPREKLSVLVWYYYMFLENQNDAPYNITMAPFNPANAPASAELGQELDFLFTYTINPRMDIAFGYSHFFAGDYYKLTPGLAYRGDAEFYYTQFQWNF